LFCQKNKKREPSPLVGEGGSGSVGRGKSEQKGKRVSYKTVLNTCPSFLNGGKKRSGIEKQKVRGRVKNLAKDMGINILTCVRKLAPIASPCSALPSVCGGS